MAVWHVVQEMAAQMLAVAVLMLEVVAQIQEVAVLMLEVAVLMLEVIVLMLVVAVKVAVLAPIQEPLAVVQEVLREPVILARGVTINSFGWHGHMPSIPPHSLCTSLTTANWTPATVVPPVCA